jgi:glycine hydroxymethyltransferase
MTDFLFRGSLSQLAPEVYELTQLEAERQVRKLIMIPSESTAPVAVREAMGSVFQNLYAEGYPDEETRWMKDTEILDFPARLAHYRRYADPRYYKGVEYADLVESLARRRCAEAFSTPTVSADQLYVNIQALSGAPANNAVYHALINPGDVVLGMNLLHGGHLTHGSSVNRSGKLYKVVHYNVDPVTEQIDYDAIAALAREHKPRILIAGYSSYPFIPDWARYRAIADEVGAVLLADVSHIAGLIAGKVVPSPVGFAHVITFTTHKTLCGPRGACIITQDAAMGRKIDRAIFPGEQGGPHVHIFGALAVTFKLAQTTEFARLQQQILKNCAVLTDQLRTAAYVFLLAAQTATWAILIVRPSLARMAPLSPVTLPPASWMSRGSWSTAIPSPEIKPPCLPLGFVMAPPGCPSAAWSRQTWWKLEILSPTCCWQPGPIP